MKSLFIESNGMDEDYNSFVSGLEINFQMHHN